VQFANLILFNFNLLKPYLYGSVILPQDETGINMGFVGMKKYNEAI
jgi:hypothetical protein